MSEPVTLQCEIPGLLRMGSVVDWCGAQYAVDDIDDNDEDGVDRWCWVNDGTVQLSNPNLRLDLSDPTSRIHAAWWVIERGPVTEEEHVILLTVKNGGHLNRKGQQQLRDMVLRRYNRSQT